MGNRLELQTRLEDILASRNCYFQPPTSVQLRYPAIIYSLGGVDTRHANDKLYKSLKRYELVLIDKNPDSELFDKILDLSYCYFDRFYTADNLNHWVFTLYH